MATPTDLTPLIKQCADYIDIPGNHDGGNLHRVLGDGSIEKGFVIGAYHTCDSMDDPAGKAICDVLLDLTEDERREVWNAVRQMRHMVPASKAT